MTRDKGAGLVCSSYLGNSEAANLCRASGYVSGMVYRDVVPEPVSGWVWRADLYCLEEADTETCARDGWQFGSSQINTSDSHLWTYDCTAKGGNLAKVFCFDRPCEYQTKDVIS